MAKRAYDLVRTMVEEHGGKMWFQRRGQPQGGAWIIEYQGYRKEYPTCDHIFPGIDDLYVPKVPYPETWDDYKHELIPNAWEKLFEELQ